MQYCIHVPLLHTAQVKIKHNLIFKKVSQYIAKKEIRIVKLFQKNLFDFLRVPVRSITIIF